MQNYENLEESPYRPEGFAVGKVEVSDLNASM